MGWVSREEGKGRRKGWPSHMVLVKSLDLQEPQASYLKDEVISEEFVTLSKAVRLM